MTSAADRAHGTDPPVQPAAGAPWPSGVSREPTMSIGTVLAALSEEFPALTISKLRFLEEQGLVAPHRAASGYRKYSYADIERVRFTLAAQRDEYLPLRVIREQLADLDAGRSIAKSPGTRIVSRDGELVAPYPSTRVSSREIADLTGAALVEIEELTTAGLIVSDSRGRYPGRAVQVVQAARKLEAQGISPRHLRSVRAAAKRQADTIDQAVAPLRAQRSGAARERSAARAMELAELYAHLQAELLRLILDEQ